MRRTLLLTIVLAACSGRPARYVDRPVVEVVGDDRPIPVPRVTPLVEAFHLSDVYVRRPLVDALDLRRFPYAKDVNALDEVPASSWFAPLGLESGAFRRGYARDGPPVPPLRLERGSKSWHVTDSRGKRYVLGGDVDGLSATSTAAAIVASRLIRAVGYRAPETWLLDRETLDFAPDQGPAGPRLVATRWPVGIELGPTDMTSPRGDDPNDRVPHPDRRTLRALGVVAAWLDMRELGPQRLVDVYVGRPNRGHVQHFVTGLQDALGAGRLGKSPRKPSAVGTARGSPLLNLVTLGLARPDDDGPRAKSLLVLSPNVSPDFELGEPYEPIDRLLPSDGYWAAKRIARVPAALLKAAVNDASIEDPAVASHVVAALERRRRTLIEHWFARVTPCEVRSLSGRALTLGDEAPSRDDSVRRYRVELLGEDGRALAPLRWVPASTDEFEVTLPKLEDDYVVVRVRAERAGVLAPRSMEVHLVHDRGTVRVVGVRH